jgi:hypothetical protein
MVGKHNFATILKKSNSLAKNNSMLTLKKNLTSEYLFNRVYKKVIKNAILCITKKTSIEMIFLSVLFHQKSKWAQKLHHI